MTAKKLSSGAVRNFQVGDRVVWDKAANAVYEVVKVSGVRATISLLECHPQTGSTNPPAKRRVLLDKIKPLDVGSNSQNYTKSSRGFAVGDRIIEPLNIESDSQCHTKSSRGFVESSRGFAVGDRVKDKWHFGTIESFDANNVTIAWDTGDCDRIGHPTSTYCAAWQLYQDLEKCSYNLTSVAGLAQDFRLQESSLEDSNLKDCVKSINSATTDCAIASLVSPSTPTCDRYSPVLEISTLSVVALHANPFPLTANAEVQQMSATVSPPSCIPSTQYSQTSLPLKTCQDCSVAPSDLANQLAHILHICSGKFGEAGTMHNGFVLAAATLAPPSLDADYYWLESPGALSSDMSRGPGLSKSESKWQKSGLLKRGEVANPDFLEQCFGLPKGWTSPLEYRQATELLEQDVQHSAIALTPELQVSPSAASSTSIPSVNNYSPLFLEEPNSYAPLIPLELKSDEKECNKKVLGDSNYLAPVIPLEPKQSLVLGDNRNNSLLLGPEQQNLVLGDNQDNLFPLEPEQKRSLVLEEGNSYASVIPLEPEQEPNLVLGDNQNNSSLLEPEPPTKRKASGWLERYTKTKKLKGGAIATYPRVEGERDPNNSEHWYWAYRWEEKRDTAKSDNGYVTRAVSLPKNKVEAVQLAIARRWSQEQILSFIQGEL